MFIWCKFLKQAFMWTHALFCMLSRAGSPWETGQASWYDDCIYSPCLRGSDKLGPAVARYTVILVTVLTPCSWESFVGKVFDFHREYYGLFKGCMGRNDTTRLATVSVLYFFFSLPYWEDGKELWLVLIFIMRGTSWKSDYWWNCCCFYYMTNNRNNTWYL